MAEPWGWTRAHLLLSQARFRADRIWRFSAYLDNCPPAAQAYRRMLIQRISETAEGLHAQATTTGAQRLARLLITLADRHGRPIGPQASGPERVITLPLSQEELSDLALASRATATRALADWRKRNLVQTGHRRITVIDPAALRRLGGLDPQPAGLGGPG